jgi:acyl transferase domain-containing protein/acyl carrier protein/3-hydroxymyristoyl/3-hydroxydecanoyl-(acyl carrier protein) dehydratase
VDAEVYEPIAVIGMAGRFPGARDIHELWRNLVGGVESISFFTDDELRENGVSEEDIANPNYVKASPITQDADLFDPGYFGMTAREAEVQDPQQRVFLEACDTALQYAGYNPWSYPERIGVYGGVGVNTYLDFNVNTNPDIVDMTGKLSTNIANTNDYLATSVAYRLALRGPAFTCLSACSTSMVAIHLACQALRDGDCEMALAGGVEEFIPAVAGYFYSEGGLYSPDGHCRTFDAKARGTVFGSGTGVVLLKPLSAAQRDGDIVLAVVRGSAVNNDGSDKGAFTAPSVSGQHTVVSEALRRAGVDPGTISYVEAHGTSTFVGDPIEVNALSKAYQVDDRRQYCGIGSVKTNVGHLGAAAGVTGMIKTVLAMHHRVLPPTINYDEPNPQIDFENSPFYVNSELKPWRSADGGPLRAGVSSFGVGGTNAHVVLEQAPARPEPAPPRRGHQLMLLSARTPTALETSATELGAHLREHPGQFADAAYTLAVGRAVRPVRSFLVAADAGEAADRLAAGVPLPRPAMVPPRGVKRAIAFMFPGQGAQYLTMGRDLYETEPVFRREFDDQSAVLAEHTGWDLRELLYPRAELDAADTEAATARLNETSVTQPALFVVEYAMATLLQSWGVRPTVMMGHSIGEYVAACLAGVFGRDDAIALVAARGQLMQDMERGSMVAVPLSEELLAPMLTEGGEGEGLDLAAVNAPGLCVVSGPDDAVRRFREVLSVQGVECRPLHTSHAFHSRMMDPMLAAFTAQVEAVKRQPPAVPFVSNLTGRLITDEQACDPGYWTAHLRGAVRFADAVALLTAENHTVLLEVGPGSTLSVLARRRLDADRAGLAVSTMRHPQQRQSDVAVLLAAIGQVWQAGADLDLSALWADEGRLRVALPPVPYEKQRCWLDANPAVTSAVADAATTETGPYYLPVWRETALPAPSTVDTTAVWVLMEDDRGLLAALRARLRAAGATVLTVRPGEAPSGVGTDTFTVRPRVPSDYADVIRAAIAVKAERLRIVHGFLAGELPGDTAVGRARVGVDLGFYSILSTVQAVGREPSAPPMDLYLVTTELRDVVGTERIEPTRAGVDGFVTLVPKEVSQATCRSIDLGTGEVGMLADQLLHELGATGERGLVAYRGRKRWLWDYQEVDLPGTGAADHLLPDGGVYLITGGLGGIGLVTARDLAERHAARLVLVGRSGLPDRAEWDDYLAGHDENDPTARKLVAIREMEAAGGQVLVCAADVTDVQSLRGVRAAAEQAFGPVQVVLHGAGVTGGGMLETRSFDDAEVVLAAKVFGTLAIDEVFGDDIDLLVLYSSFTVFSGDFGLGDYCSANAMMDSYAHTRSSGRTRVVSVNWPIWKKLGMAEDIDAPDLLTDFEMGDRYEKVAHPLLGSRLIRPGNNRVIFVKNLSTADWVTAEHQLEDTPTMPGTSLVEMIRAAYQEVSGQNTCEIRDVVFMRPVMFAESLTIHTILTPTSGGGYDVSICDADGTAGVPVEYTTGKVGPAPAGERPVHDVSAWKSLCGTEDRPEGKSEAGIISLGPRWDCITAHWHSPHSEQGLFDELVRLELGAAHLGDLDDFGLHPALLDKANALGQTVVASQTRHLPFGYDRLVVRAPLPARFYSFIHHLDDTRGSLIRTDITLADDSGAELVSIKGFTMFEYNDSSMQAPSADVDSGAPETNSEDDQEEGFTVARQLERALLRSNERAFGIEPGDGYRMLREIVHYSDAASIPQLIVCPDSMTKRLRMASEVTRDALREQLAAAPVRTASVSPRTLMTPYVEPDNDVQRVLAGMWADTLAVDLVGIDDDFFDLNGNSLIAVQLVARLREQFQVDLAVATLFEARNVRALATAIEQLLVAMLEQLDDEDAAARLAGITTQD